MMNNFKTGYKFFLFLALLLSPIFSFFVSQKVNAASAFDTNYQTTDKLEVHDEWLASSKDITDIWTNIILAPDTIEENVRYFAGNRITDDQQLEGYRDILRNMKNWTISATFAEGISSNGSKYPRGVVYVNLSTKENMYLRWIGSQVMASGTELALTISHDKRYGFDVNFSSGYNVISNSSGDVKNYVAYVQNQNVPENYEGEPVRQSIAEDFFPNFEYEVTDKNLLANIKNPIAKLPTTDDLFGIEWNLYSCSSYDEVNKSCESPELLKQGQLSQSDSFKYDFKDYGHYRLTSQYIIKKCIRYDSYPATPDHCWYQQPESNMDYNYSFSSVILDVNGDNLKGSTDDSGCVYGVCFGQPMFEVCEFNSITDLPSFITCEVGNFFKFLGNFFKSMFVPNMEAVSSAFNPFVDRLKTSLGFLYAPFDFFVQLFNLARSQSVNPTGTTCSLGNLAMFGHNGLVELCAWRYQFPALWDIMQKAIQGGLAFGLFIAYWRKFVALFGGHIEDDEEDSPYSGSDDWIVTDRHGNSMTVKDYRGKN